MLLPKHRDQHDKTPRLVMLTKEASLRFFITTPFFLLLFIYKLHQ